MIVCVTYVNIDNLNSVYIPTHILSFSFQPPPYRTTTVGLGRGREVLSEDSWIKDLSFVTLYFHSFATEER